MVTKINNIGSLLDTCKDEYFLVEESTGNIYYQYKEEKKGWCFKKYDTTLDVPIIDIKES